MAYHPVRRAFVAALAISACSPETAHEVPTPRVDLPSGTDRILVIADANTDALLRQAHALGLQVSGEAVLEIAGDPAKLAALTKTPGSSFQAIADTPMLAEPEGQPATPDETVFMLAKKDFGLPAYWETNPTHDGRSVVVGVIDDGISPHLSGFQTTTTGARKVLLRGSQSTLLHLPVTENTEGGSAFLNSIDGEFDTAWTATIDETVDIQGSSSLDLNLDGQQTVIEVAVVESVLESGDKRHRVCVDSNASGVAESDECFGLFSATGEYGYWSREPAVVVMAEFFPADGIVALSQGEPSGSHGEGVASVLAGHQIGGLFDGVAPGAQIIDYDLGERTREVEEYLYSMATFVRALEFLGQNGAEVINISYSLFFTSAASQRFMHDALAALVAKYGFVISFSAGNNGPGLGSYNRGLIYPPSTLSAGAFVSKDLDEYVHGVTGLPDPGRVVYYSSRGPAPDGAGAPVVVSPLASLVHKNGDGFGAFSGTSSASPALAGLATILISAAKDKGLAIDPTAVVHAIRMSATPLAGTPFIDQGAGLPNIERAVALYEQLVQGEQFAHLDTQVGQTGPDGILARGIVLRTSDGTAPYETNIWTRGVFAPAAVADAPNLLVPLEVQYTAPWLSGPSHSFLSLGWSQQWIQVDVEAVLATSDPMRDHSAEIHYLDAQTGQRLWTVPVTVIDDSRLDAGVDLSESLGPEQGKRRHFDIPTGTIGVRVRAHVNQGNPSTLSVKLYEPSGRGVRSRSASLPDKEILFPVDQPGWHQLALYKRKGTGIPLDVDVTVEPVALSISSSGVPLTAPFVQINNHGKSALPLVVSVARRPEQVSEAVLAHSISSPLSYTVAADQVGTYHFRYAPAVEPDVTYASVRCMGIVYDANGSVTGFDAPPVAIDETNVGGHIEFHCRPFEYTGTDNTAPLSWNVQIYRSQSSAFLTHTADSIALLEPGHNKVVFPDLGDVTPGQVLEVRVRPVFENDLITVGQVVAY